MAKVTNLTIKQQSGTERTFFATWSFANKNLDKYTVTWYYKTKDDIWFVSDSSDIKNKQSVFDAPANALQIKITVKPVSTKKKKGNKEVSHWTGETVSKTFNLVNSLHVTPSKPEVSITKYLEAAANDKTDANQYKLVVTCDDIDTTTKSLNYIEFYVHVGASAKPTYSSGLLEYKETAGHIKWVQTVPVGTNYRVRSRFFLKKNKTTGGEYSPWSSFVSTPPATPVLNNDPDKPSRLVRVDGNTAEVFIQFSRPSSTTNYTIEYTYKKVYFNASTSEVQSWNSSQAEQGWSKARISDIDLSKGNTWFFRIKGSNEAGDSYWSDPISLVLGKKPGIPTTWSSTNTAITGETVNLYWVHNAEDCSTQTSAQVEITANGDTKTYTVINPYVNDEENKNKTLSYALNTVSLGDADVTWRVRTAGAIANEYGDWSIIRKVTVRAEPTLSLTLTEATTGVELGPVISSLPFYINALPGPASQTPLSYHVSIISDEEYTDVDPYGNEMTVIKGQAVYSEFFEMRGSLHLRMGATDANIRGGITYTVHCVVSMDSGLSKEAIKSFTPEWVDETYLPSASIEIEAERGYIAVIRPYCNTIKEIDGELVDSGERADDVTLSVYRREYDGTFVEIESDVENDGTVIVDRHPALDFARYRIVATSKTTGAISYEDVDEIVDCHSIIIQWDEDDAPAAFADDPDNVDDLEANPYPGFLLNLPYNIDITDEHDQDVSLVKYVGRSHPVSYYGTQKGISATWNTVIPGYDTETLYLIRQLAIYAGDVYVREPSGIGYRANIKVSYSVKHMELTIPITFSITRVEGGV